MKRSLVDFTLGIIDVPAPSIGNLNSPPLSNIMFGPPQVILRHAWHIEHNGPLGSCPDFALLDALTPTRKPDAAASALEGPSASWADYEVPAVLPAAQASRVKSFVDLVMV